MSNEDEYNPGVLWVFLLVVVVNLVLVGIGVHTVIGWLRG